MNVLFLETITEELIFLLLFNLYNLFDVLLLNLFLWTII